MIDSIAKVVSLQEGHFGYDDHLSAMRLRLVLAHPALAWFYAHRYRGEQIRFVGACCPTGQQAALSTAGNIITGSAVVTISGPGQRTIPASPGSHRLLVTA